MGLETGTYINDLVATNPVGATDPKGQGDDHIRLIKSTIKNTWPNVAGEVTADHDDLSAIDGLGAFTTDNYIRKSASGIEERTPAEVLGDLADETVTWTAAHTFSGGATFNTETVAFNLIDVPVSQDAFYDAGSRCAIYRSSSSFTTPSGFVSAGNLILHGGVDSTSRGLLIAQGSYGGTLTFRFGVNSSGNVCVIGDGTELRIGGTDDFALYHDGTNNYIDGNTGHLIVRGNGTNSIIMRDGGDNARVIFSTSTLRLYGGSNAIRLEINDTANGVTYAPYDGGPTAEIGYRAIPRETTGGTLTAAMNGTCQAVSAGVTVPNSIFAAGDCVMIYNNSASAITITQGSGVTLRLAGTATTGNRTLAARGFATLWFNTASECIASGNVS